MSHPNDFKRPNSRSGSVGQFMRSRWILVHLSAQLFDHPLYAAAARIGRLSTYTGPRWSVRNEQPYNMGRNAAKRARRTRDALHRGPAKTAKGSRLGDLLRPYQREHVRRMRMVDHAH